MTLTLTWSINFFHSQTVALALASGSSPWPWPRPSGPCLDNNSADICCSTVLSQYLSMVSKTISGTLLTSKYSITFPHFLNRQTNYVAQTLTAHTDYYANPRCLGRLDMDIRCTNHFQRIAFPIHDSLINDMKLQMIAKIYYRYVITHTNAQLSTQ